jgi:ATP-dependent exoDNAse (exonuclease V) beta subunit
VLVGGRSFHECEEVIALRNALAAIEWPDDELSVFATLRGPFFALNDEALLLFRQEVETDGTLRTRRLNPMRPIDRATIPPETAGVADALELLRDLHIGRNHRPIAQTIMMLLQAVRAHAGLALWPTGEQALANTQRLIDMARQFERSASSFRAFVNKLDLDGEHGEADEAPIVEEGTEGVRLMTVHKAKGLQFPVVILADPTCSAARDDPSRHVDIVRRVWLEPLCGSAPVELLEAAAEEQQREQDEAIRVAYVASTRARDLLVAPVCGDQAIDGWLTVLDRVLYRRIRRGQPPHLQSVVLPSVRTRSSSAVARVRSLPEVQSNPACITQSLAGRRSCGGIRRASCLRSKNRFPSAINRSSKPAPTVQPQARRTMPPGCGNANRCLPPPPSLH